MTDLLQHLKDRHLDVQLHRPVLDYENDLATFYLWNLSGALVGYQMYRRFGSKKPQNNLKEGKYYTYRKQPTLALFGVESLHLTPHVVFLTEGLFDAARVTEKGFSALAVLSNDAGTDLKNFLTCLNRKVVAVCDADTAGKKLAKFGNCSVFTTEKDLGDSSDDFVKNLLATYG